MTTAEVITMHEEIRALAAERDAVILAHNYQVPEVQDVADYVGDSLGLSREAAATDSEAIVFCGVHFMAETAAILSPQKTVLIPDLDAGCSLAASISADQLRAWKAENPGAVVVSYVNTTAEVKAESDYCCTSGNAKGVIESIPEDTEILFLPDMFLGLWLEKVTRRKLRIWMGECHERFLVATETGIIHRLNKEAPEKRFEAVSEKAICRYMKMITLPKLLDSLRDWKYEVTVPDEIAERARGAIDRMVAIS